MRSLPLVRAAASIALALGLQLGAGAQPQTVPAQPEAASGYQEKTGWSLKHFGVAAAHPLAAEAGDRMLHLGGSAVDALVATQLVLGLVEPQSSGLGGGAFLMSWDGRQLQAWDGRESAPAGARPEMFLRPDGRPLSVPQAIVGGLSVGTPGVLAMLAEVHRSQGHLPWATLFQPAIELAEAGFPVGERLHGLLMGERALHGDAQAAAYFFDARGEPWPVGHRLRNPAYAALLRRIAAEGVAAFYRGPAAADIVRRVRGHARPGSLSEADLAGYRALRRDPLCADWLARYQVCGFPPPSSGQLTMMQILGLIEARGEPARRLVDGVPSADWLHLYTEASNLAFADRARYIADPAFVAPPGGSWMRLLDRGYLRQRAALIGARSAGEVQAGTPGPQQQAYAPQAEQLEHGTSHISIVDAQGHAVAMTTSIEAGFGARIMSDGGTGLAGGFLLNNTLTDFSMAPTDAQGLPVANRAEPGKRPRSSMSPTLVFDRRDGRLLMSAGAPGGPAIIHFVAKTLIGALDWGLDLQAAVSQPNYGSFNGPVVVEADRFPAATLTGLRVLGHQVQQVELPSGIQAIQRRPEGWFGAADPRREGVVRGD